MFLAVAAGRIQTPRNMSAMEKRIRKSLFAKPLSFESPKMSCQYVKDGNQSSAYFFRKHRWRIGRLQLLAVLSCCFLWGNFDSKPMKIGFPNKKTTLDNDFSNHCSQKTYVASLTTNKCLLVHFFKANVPVFGEKRGNWRGLL